MNKLIDRAVAKLEIERINEVLSSPLLLIGGLAVQQYYPARVSKDIDLVCSFEVAQAILDALYPSKDWKIEDKQNDDYRPSYRIKHKVKDKGTIIFGPKITERKPYNNIDWTLLQQGSRPFQSRNGEPLTFIAVPSPESLAYTKLISFLGRSENESKAQQDLKDFVNLTNHDDFSSSRFYDLLRRSASEEEIQKDFRTKVASSREIISQSSLFALTSLFSIETPAKAFVSTPKTVVDRFGVYVAAPHRNIARNDVLARAAREINCTVRVPYEEVHSKNLIEGVSDSVQIRKICIEAITQSDCLVVDLDEYGMDTAWEIGFGEGLGKYVIGYNEDQASVTSERFINRRIYDQNFMHGWQVQQVFTNFEDLGSACRGKTVYVCGSFGNHQDSTLHKSQLVKTAKRVIFPKDHFEAAGKLPSDYPISERQETNELFRQADMVVVMLPRYGMDTSWQIGHATALGKTIVGIIMEEDKRELVKASFWDHWMHGWKSKLRATGLDELQALLIGIIGKRRFDSQSAEYI